MLALCGQQAIMPMTVSALTCLLSSRPHGRAECPAHERVKYVARIAIKLTIGDM